MIIIEKDNPILDAFISEITALCGATKIIIFSLKRNISSDISSIKFCVICQCSDKASVERMLYLNLDSDIPFDIVLYTLEEWEKLLADESTFAAKVNKTGYVIYG